MLIESFHRGGDREDRPRRIARRSDGGRPATWLLTSRHISPRASEDRHADRRADVERKRSWDRRRRLSTSSGIRADFPILFREVYGKPLVYLDNGASAQKPLPSSKRWTMPTASNTLTCIAGCITFEHRDARAIEDARETVRRFLNAPAVDQIIFTRNATEAINLVASSFGAARYRRRRRDRAVDHGASLQHRAVAFPSRALRRGPEVGAYRR